MNLLFFFKNYIKKGIISDDFYIFALSNCNNIEIPMSLRHIFLCVLMTAIISPALGQNAAGCSIVSRTYDDYTFIGQHGVPSSLAASSVIGIALDLSLGQGLHMATFYK